MSNNNRRQTLGGLSPAMLNSRQSIGPARIAMEGKTAGKGPGMSGRQSVFPGNVRLAGPATAVPRRSSAHAKAGGPKHDPRRIGDKAYQANCIRTLIAYLSTHGYDQPLTPKMLANPMGKDVINIMQFLMRQVDPHSKNQGKIEDEVPALFKRLRYPYTISKSALFAVGSPHTWPGLLAALVWLTELLYYEEKAEQVREQTFDDKARSESDFFNYVSTAYRHFLSGNDEECAAVDEAQTQVFHNRAEATRTRNAELQQENERLSAEVEAMRASPSPLEEAREKHQEHVSDRDKFRKLLDNLQSHKEGLQRKVAERTADLRSKQQQLAAIEQENAEMRAKIAAQTVSRDDVIRMNHERLKQEQRLGAVAAQREALDARVAEQERACERRLDDLDAALQTYHTAADRLQLIPASAKRAAGIQYEISLDRSGTTASELINVDFKGVVKAGLVRVREASASRARELAEEALALQEGLDGAQHCLSERAEENAAMSTQVAALERQLAAAKEAMEADMRAKAAEADALKGVVDELRNATCHTIAGSEAAILALQGQAEEAVRANEAEAEQLNGDLAEALQALLDHKLHLQRTLDHTHSHLHSVADSIAAIPV